MDVSPYMNGSNDYKLQQITIIHITLYHLFENNLFTEVLLFFDPASYISSKFDQILVSLIKKKIRHIFKVDTLLQNFHCRFYSSNLMHPTILLKIKDQRTIGVIDNFFKGKISSFFITSMITISYMFNLHEDFSTPFIHNMISY